MAQQTTQQLIDIDKLRRDVVVLKNGSLRAIIEVAAINFELRSEDEQTALLQNFQNFLNAVDFPIQIVLQSRKLLMDDYIRYVKSATKDLDELLKIQAMEYMRFAEELSNLANIMSKKFYVVIPFFFSENIQKVGLREGFRSLFKKPNTIKEIPDEQFDVYRGQLIQRAELVLDGLLSMGLRSEILDENRITKIFFDLYNPKSNHNKDGKN